MDIEIARVSNYDLATWIRENLTFDQLILECYHRGVPNSGWVHVSLKPEAMDNRHIAMTFSNRKYMDGLMA